MIDQLTEQFNQVEFTPFGVMWRNTTTGEWFMQLPECGK